MTCNILLPTESSSRLFDAPKDHPMNAWGKYYLSGTCILHLFDRYELVELV